jgi:hypothetical protein
LGVAKRPREKDRHSLFHVNIRNNVVFDAPFGWSAIPMLLIFSYSYYMDTLSFFSYLLIVAFGKDFGMEDNVVLVERHPAVSTDTAETPRQRKISAYDAVMLVATVGAAVAAVVQIALSAR